jgi:hypothetical protein
MEQISEVLNRLLDIVVGFGIVGVIFMVIGFVIWLFMFGAIFKHWLTMKKHFEESWNSDPCESLFGKDYKKRRNEGKDSGQDSDSAV